jgi:enterochelin esterase family protein
MSLAIEELQQEQPLTSKRVQEFLTSNSFPLVEGSTATFVYQGNAETVHLQHWIYGLESSQSFARLKGSDLWYLVLELPSHSRVEYKIRVSRGDGDEWLRDPLNPMLAHDPFGANSVCHGFGYQTPEWTHHDPQARTGDLERLEMHSEALAQDLAVELYLPARFRTRGRDPLLIVHDGADYLRFAGLRTVLDNLIHRLEIPPLVVALTHSHDRLNEYANSSEHAHFLTRELVPLLEQTYPLVQSPSARGLMGASFGAVAALSAAWRYPGFFGRLLLQSGSFAFTDIGQTHRGPVFEPVVKFVNEFRKYPSHLAEKMFVSCGTYESLIYENRSLVPLLQATGMEVRYTEARDGHNWENWRDRLREGLSWLFPGPLWLVYE